MRIQHNIMAMSAYRNYTNNVSAMKKNLEKLSSGYKINRAGDDAAGLAISEKMRAQITGLETAQKNAKDGISLVQTAEGALTEVHDMLNRMVELATQSANGTYDDTLDRDQMQKELDELRSEINRIADSANFNGINLLDGSMDAESTAKADAIAAADAAQAAADAAAADAPNATGEIVFGNESSFTLPAQASNNTPTPGEIDETILETDYAPSGKPGFSLNLDGLKHTFKDPASNSTNTGEYLSIKIGTPANNGSATSPVETEIQLTEADIAAAYKEVTGNEAAAGDTATADVLAKAVQNKIESTGVITTGTEVPKEFTIDDGTAKDTYTVKADGSRVVFELKGDPGNDHAKVPNYQWKVTPVTEETIAAEGNKYTTGALTQTGTDGNKDATVTIKYKDADGNDQSVDVDFKTDTGASDSAAALITALSGDSTLSDLFTVSGDNTGIVLTTKDAESAAAVTSITVQTASTDGISIAAGETEDAHGEYKVGTTGYGEKATSATIQTGTPKIDQLASTSIELDATQVVDGAALRLGDQTYVFAIGEDSAYKNVENAVYVADMVAGTDYTEDNDGTLTLTDAGLDKMLTKLSEVAQNNTTFSVSHSLADDGEAGKIGLKQLEAVKESTDMSTMDKLGSYIGLTSVDEEKTAANTAAAVAEATANAAKLQEEADKLKEAAEKAVEGKALTLQIGDTADDFNQLKVNIKDCHTTAMGIANISVANQEDAATALDAIKDAINYVSDVRGTLGATQNRLDHTINNLSVMTENIQDAESTIRDVDVAEEMMAYTKNNILIQSAQAMLAQANQVPQGVLQLLG